MINVMKRYVVLVVVFGLLVAGVIGLWKEVAGLRAENKRLSDNQRTLLSDVVYYKTRDSLSAASVERLSLSVGEFERYCSELLGTVEALNVRIKRLQSVSETATKTEYVIETEVKDVAGVGLDSVGFAGLFRRADSAADSAFVSGLRCVDYSDAWLSLSGCVDGNVFRGRIESYDTLITVVHRVPKRFLFFRYGTKGIRQDVVSRNPHSRIVYTGYIELKK
jgi:hypothetical protein